MQNNINTTAIILLGQCPSIHSDVNGTADIVVLTELGGICPELGWHDEVGLSCADWINWGHQVDHLVDTW